MVTVRINEKAVGEREESVWGYVYWMQIKDYECQITAIDEVIG